MPAQSAPKIALVGDYSHQVVAHRAIPRAFELLADAGTAPPTWEWVATSGIRDATEDLAGYDGIWVVPGSPYTNKEGALSAIQWARSNGVPFLGTCGGFQHALIEFGRNVAGLAEADHAETNPAAATLVVTPLSCSLVEKSGKIWFQPGSRLRAIYGDATALEGYHCSYGVNPAHQDILALGGLNFTAHDDAGAIRAFELPVAQHPFFIGTLFQPERAALTGEIPKLVAAFVAATLKTAK